MNNLQPEICTMLVRKYRRGMITLPEMVKNLNAALAAQAAAETSQQPEIRAKLPLYTRMVINYQAAITKCMKK